MKYHFNDIDGRTNIESPFAKRPRRVGTHHSQNSESTRYHTHAKKGYNAYDATPHDEENAKLDDKEAYCYQEDISKNL